MDKTQIDEDAALILSKNDKQTVIQFKQLLYQMEQERDFFANKCAILENEKQTIKEELEAQKESFEQSNEYLINLVEDAEAQKSAIEYQHKLLQEQQDKITQQNKAFENIVEELRTNQDEINMQKEYLLTMVQEMENKQAEIEMQRDYLTTMVQQLETSQNEVVEKNKLLEQTSKILQDAFTNIKSSINYAKRIQDAMLPNKGLLERFFQDSFIFFKPKDVVSGDFYWYTVAGNKIIVAAVDCTGHGVPGAFMSMLGMELLHHIVNVQRFDTADEILNQLHINVRRVLKQESGENRDGMDISLLIIDKRNKSLEFAGAHNPLIWIRNKELQQVKADRQSIGGFQREPAKNFTKHIIHYEAGDVFYIFSDGYQDMCNGKTGKRFMSSRFRSVLAEIHQHPMHKQEEILNKIKKYWIKKDSQQLDDILVIGIRV